MLEKAIRKASCTRRGMSTFGHNGDWLFSPRIGHAVCMSKPLNVVSIAEQNGKLIARDTKAHRIIFGIGSERMAIDFFSRITKLPPNTGDQPAAVLSMQRKNVRKARGMVGRERRNS